MTQAISNIDKPTQRLWLCAIPRSILRAAPCLILATLLLAGCRGSSRHTYPVSGTVKLSGGQPLKTGLVTFRLTNDPEPVTARGQIQSDGTFRLTTFAQNDGAVAGRYQALVVVPVVESDGPSARPPFDLRFSNYETSGLEFTVTDDPQKNQFNIVVTK